MVYEVWSITVRSRIVYSTCWKMPELMCSCLVTWASDRIKVLVFHFHFSRKKYMNFQHFTFSFSYLSPASHSLCFYCYLLWFVKGKGIIMFQEKSAANCMLVLNAISNCKSITCIWNCNIQLHEHWPQLNWLDIWPDLWHIVSELAKCKLGKRR